MRHVCKCGVGGGSTSSKPAVELCEADTKNGEEDESTAFHGDGRLFQFVDNQWRERGSGDMRLNVAPSGDHSTPSHFSSDWEGFMP